VVGNNSSVMHKKKFLHISGRPLPLRTKHFYTLLIVKKYSSNASQEPAFYSVLKFCFMSPTSWHLLLLRVFSCSAEANKTENVRVTQHLGALDLCIFDFSQMVIPLNPLQLHFSLSFKVCTYKTAFSYYYYGLLFYLWGKI
jgi:hypothetical protein